MVFDLHNGDALSILSTLENDSVDLIIVDPPYRITTRGRGTSTTSGGMFAKKEVNNGKIFANNDLKINDWIHELYRVLKPDSHCYIMTNNKNIENYLSIIKGQSQFHYVKNLIWVKDNKITSQTYMSQFEYIIFLRKGKHKKINNCGTSDVLQIPNKKTKDGNGNNLHDTEKPVDLMKILVENSSNVGDVVLDCFMGIGSTGVACKELDRAFIGVELDENYYTIAKNRMEE